MLKKTIEKYNRTSAPVKMAFWFLVCSILQKGIGVITTPIFTRIMTDSEFGRYGVYNSWYSIIAVFVTLSISGNCFTRGLVVTDTEEERHTLASSFLGIIITLIIGFGIIYLLFHNWINNVTKLNSYQFIMMGIDFLTIQASDLWINQKRVKYEYKGIVALTILVTILRPLLAVVFVLKAPANAQVEARLTGIAITNTALFSWIIIYIWVKGKKFFDKKKWIYAFTFCFPLIPHYLSKTILNQSDRIMISHFVGDAEAGYYTIAYTIASIMALFNSAVAQSLDPWIYQSLKEKKLNKIGPVSYKITAVIALMSFTVMALAPEVLSILAPANYQNALWVIPPVTASVFFQFMYDLFASFQFFYNKTKWIAIGSCGGAILNVVLNAIFIPLVGYIAAGYTTLVCYVLFGVLHYYFMRKVCKEKLDDYRVYDWKIIFGIGGLLVLSSMVMIVLYSYSTIRYIFLSMLIVYLFLKRKDLIRIYNEIRERG